MKYSENFIRIGDSKGKYTSFSDIFQSRGPIGACSKETVKLKKKEGKKGGAPASVNPGTDTDTGSPHALTYCPPLPVSPLPARRRRNDKKEEREKDRGPLASGPVTVCHNAIRRLAAGAQYVAYTLRSTTPATPPKKGASRTNEPNHARISRPPPFQLVSCYTRGWWGAGGGGGGEAGVNLRSSRRKAKE